MNFKVLIDNSAGNTDLLQAEHGLSFWFEADGQQWMLDVGASCRFLENAAVMGVAVADVDHLLLSHAHADHTGGLETFLRTNDKGDIWLSSHIDGRHFYSTRRGPMRDISIDYQLLEQFRQRCHFVSGTVPVSPSVTLLISIPEIFPCPKANATLYADACADNFSHEMAVLVEDGDGFNVLSSCSHKGILNTLQAARQLTASTGKPLKAYIGGLHLVDPDETHQYESETEIAWIADTVRREYPGLTVFTGHCTGASAVAGLRRVLGDRLVKFYTGFEYETIYE